MPDPTPEITICATGKSGLGHLRRCSTIARALARRAPGVAIRLLTNAAVGGLEDADLRLYSAIAVVEREAMAAAIRRDATGPVVVDTASIPGIERCGRPRMLIMREMPADREERFVPDDPADRWNLVIVPNPADHWMPASGERLAHRIAPVGWIYRPTSPAPPRRDGAAQVLIATGGGGKAGEAAELANLLDAIVAAARARTDTPFEAIQATGPRLPASGLLAQADRQVDPGGELNRHFGAADVVISTAGYNSVLELASLDVPTLLVPIPRSIDDQAARVRLWGPRVGAGHLGGIEESAAWLARTIAARSRRTPCDLGPSGEDEAARLILEFAA
jgi:hypothetical protein